MKPNSEVDRLFVHRIARANGTVRDNSSEVELCGRLCSRPQARILAVLTLIFLMPTSVWAAVSAKVIESNGWSGSILFWSAAVLLALISAAVALYFYRKNRQLKEAMSRLRDLKNQSLPESVLAPSSGDATAASAPSSEIELPDDKTVSRKSAQAQKPQPPVLEIPLPEPPQALHKAIARGRCIAVVGSGMNAQYGLMTWTEMLESVVSKSFDPKTVEYYQHDLAGGRVDTVAESLRSELGLDALAEHISTLIPKEFQDAYEQMRAVKFAGIINLNFDTLASNALPSASVWSHTEARSCLDRLSRGEPFVIKLNGTVGAGDMLFSNQDLQDVVAQNAPLRDLLRRLYYSHTLLFLGVSLAGVQNFFRLIDRSSQESSQHFALIEAVDESYIYMSKNLSQFGVTVMPFSVQDRTVAIRHFLSELETAGDVEDQLIEDETINKISRAELRNIGPLEWGTGVNK